MVAAALTPAERRATLVRLSLRAALAMGATIALLAIAVWALRPYRQLLLLAAAVSELAFAFVYFSLHSAFSSAEGAAPSDLDPELVAEKLRKHLERMDIRAFLTSWFVNDVRWEDIRRDNLVELFSYAVYYKRVDEMREQGLLCRVEGLVSKLEEQLGEPVPPGYTPGLQFMGHLWEPIRHVFRPLVFYGVMELLALLGHVALLAAGFTRRARGGVSYYTLGLCARPRAAAGQAQGQQREQCGDHHHHQQQQQGEQGGPAGGEGRPIVFLHGVGAGLLPYLSLVFHLASLGRPMVLPASRHVSMRLVSWLPTVEDMADATAAILAAHGFGAAAPAPTPTGGGGGGGGAPRGGVAVVAHSYGTMVAARLAMQHEPLVHSLCLMDPVCFALFMPDLIRNFIYRWHRSGCLPIDVIMALVSSELHTSRVFSRNFHWSSVNLWDDHVPPRTLVVLSGRDILAPTAQLDRWLREHTHAQVMLNRRMAHAGILVDIEWQSAVIDAFAQLMAQPDAAGQQGDSTREQPPRIQAQQESAAAAAGGSSGGRASASSGGGDVAACAPQEHQAAGWGGGSSFLSRRRPAGGAAAKAAGGQRAADDSCASADQLLAAKGGKG